MLSLTVKVSWHFPFRVAELLEEGLAEAVQILASSTTFKDLAESADNVARLIISQANPGGIMIEERVSHMATVKKVFEEGDWLTAEDINELQKKPPSKKSLPASNWKRRGRIFSVSYGRKNYYPRYQFDAMYQPLPIISEILKAYGECADTWSLATWFHFPNGWIVRQVGDEVISVAPKDALDRSSNVIKAAQSRKGTYVA
ncbi:hypothetical protein NX786_00695 [Telluria mixta]|uniref:Uncharacterized protein n=1 Tax=Telluria mixta TaxID=34071 RepID=A0ABT2BRW9_9BURK|nr:hypothetical protein [Telluria mixta]MCS0627865.1 hypothetical protein [Telluria mixta]WEM94017.1 hypothetical protein P0M04_21295 [Telluria mixta]